MGFLQKAASHAESALRLFDINGFREDKIRANSKSLGYSRLSFDDCYRERTGVLLRVPCRLEKQCGILLVLAIYHQRMEMILAEPFYGSKRLARHFHGKIKLTKDLRDQTRGSFVRAEQ